MNTRIETLRDWLGRSMFSLSPEKRRLLRVIREKSRILGLTEALIETDMVLIKNEVTNRRDMTLIAEHSHQRRAYAIMRLLDASKEYCGEGEIAHLTEKHFLIHDQLAELGGKKEDSLSSYLSPEAFALRRQEELILAHALHNIDEWDMIAHLLRDRDMWNYASLVAALPVMKSSRSATLANGAL
jgi:hypothetical protein